MEISVIVCLLVILLAIWIVSVRKKLAIMDENINYSMNQIGVQLSSRFDALLSLLDFTKKYAGYEAQTLTDEVNEKRCIIMETSTPRWITRSTGETLSKTTFKFSCFLCVSLITSTLIRLPAPSYVFPIPIFIHQIPY